ncbi:haloacid dehalogenase-like hydrolase domain-containing 2, partial [Phlyctochytrium arcticum]
TLHIDTTPTPNAIPALQKLRDSGVKIRFCSNTTKESGKSLVRKLQGMGFDIHSEEIFTSLTATKHAIQSRNLRPLLLLEDEALTEFEGVETEHPNAVVVGLSPSSFHYSKMNEAFRLIKEGSPLIAIHKSRYVATSTGLSLGPGPFIAALEYATETQATVIGKPSASFFRRVVGDMGVSPDEGVMIGDDVWDDVGGAIAVGMRGILVRTGKYGEGDEERKGVVPTAVFADFAAAVDAIMEQISRD